MAEDTVKHLHGQILILDLVEEPDTLYIVGKFSDPVFFTKLQKAGFAEMPIWDVTDVVPECDCFDKIFVEAQAPANRAGDLRDELDMDHPVGDVIVLDKVKDLRLVDVPGICPGMDDPVRIPRIGGPDIFRFPVLPPECLITPCGMGREQGFALLCILVSLRLTPVIRSGVSSF
jgi:hypothetical protein